MVVVFFLVVPKAVINSRLKISSTGPIFVLPVCLYIYMLYIFGILSFVGRISVLSSKFLPGQPDGVGYMSMLFKFQEMVVQSKCKQCFFDEQP